VFRSWEAIAAGTIDPDGAARALADLAAADESRAILETAPEAFLRNLGNLCVVSPPMLDSLRRHPDWIPWLRGRIDGGERAGEQEAARACRDLDELRAYKRREHLEIACLDVAGAIAFETTVERLSRLADACIAAALEHAWSGLASGPPDGFAVFAFGKLGGSELNYSSDVDLVFVRRPEAGSSDDLRFFTRLGEKLIQSLSQSGPDGFLYRVDMRLRPYGETGPLVPTLSSLIGYYESWAEAWERQALIKARFVTGSSELGRRFGEFVAGFTFARQMDDSSLEELKRIKHRSEKEHDSPDGRFNLKHGRGGIRDIEFYVQYLQLIAGSQHPEVRVAPTLEAIRRLAAARLLLDGEEAQLARSYVFLRGIEHRLQLAALTPEARMPAAGAELDRLATGLDFETAEPLRDELQSHRRRVRAILERIFLTPGYLHLEEQDEELAQLVTERTPPERAREILARYGFQDLDRAWRNFRLLALGPAGRMLPPGERRAFLGLGVPLLEVLRDSVDPDQGLDNLESFATASGNRVSFLRALASRRSHLERLVHLLALSNLARQVLVRHPEYFDTLARGAYLDERPEAELAGELRDRMAEAPAGVGAADVIRRFRQREMLRIAYRDVAGMADPVATSGELSALAEACLHAAVSRSAGGAGAEEDRLVTLGLGKLGSRQMHYASDLDLVFLYDDTPEGAPEEERVRFARLQDSRVEEILELLAGVTEEGMAYRVDLRLRPEGASGLLARSWRSFVEYAERYMRPWERMALVRSRVLFGRPAASARWAELVVVAVYGFAWDDDAIESIRHLKRRIEAEKSRETRTQLDIKYGRGGIADLEFLVQMLQIRHGTANVRARAPEVHRALEALAETEAVPATVAEQLLAAHRFQRHVENHVQLAEEWPAREMSRESPHLARIARSLGIRTGAPASDRARFLALWDDHAAAVRELVERYFYRS
jgi:glutamate-ammonia-ligase adenylyltransferase